MLRRPAALLLPLLLCACSSPSTQPGPLAGSGPTTTPTPSAAPATPAPSTAAENWVKQENQQPGTAEWRIQKGRVASDAHLAGFADHASVLPGTPVVLRVTSQAPSWTVTAFRLGNYRGLGARQVWRSGQIAGQRQAPVKVLAQQMVSAAHWTPSLTVDTAGWLPGSYLLKLVDSTGAQKYIPLTVRSQQFAGTVAFITATSTYQAYNHFGGWSLYKGPTPADGKASRVSFNRPYDQDGARFAVGYERSLIYQAEGLGLNLSYASSGDLEVGAAAFGGLVGLISPGHDEYWSVPMRTTVEALRDAGTNLAFFGANASYWRIRFDQQGREIIGHKGDGDPVSGPTTTDLWRKYRPESELIGQLYECFPAHGALVVTDPDFFAFAGTGARRGSSYPGLVGVEIDRAYPAPIGPANLQVVAHSPVQCAPVGSTFSDMTWYAAPSGAGVFAAGSMDFRSGIEAGGSAVPAGMTAESVTFATRVTANVLTALAQPRAGRQYVPRPNLATIKPPARTSTGTGGAIVAAKR